MSQSIPTPSPYIHIPPALNASADVRSLAPLPPHSLILRTTRRQPLHLKHYYIIDFAPVSQNLEAHGDA
jgi:hypothetical protein